MPEIIRLDNWSIHPVGSTDTTAYAMPEPGSHVFFRGTLDGKQIETAELVQGQGLEIWTKDGRQYELGNMSREYAVWVAREGQALQFWAVLRGQPIVHQ